MSRCGAFHGHCHWREVADQLADTLLRNGVGGKGFNAAIDAYRAATVQSDKADGGKSQ